MGYIDLRQLKWSVKVNVLLNNCKHNITSLSLLVGTTVANTYFNSTLSRKLHTTIYIDMPFMKKVKKQTNSINPILSCH